jgi:hypothetical protein
MDQGKRLTDADRTKLEQRRDKLMKLMQDGSLDADDRADLEREWKKVDDQLNHSF